MSRPAGATERANRKRVMGAVGVFYFTATLYASTVTITLTPGVTISASSVNTGVTTGADMAGISVTAIFDGGAPSETLIWTATGGKNGAPGVLNNSGNNQWSLSETADTFTSNWTLENTINSNNNITDIILDTSGSRTVFDRTSPNFDNSTNEQTPGSSRGFTFAIKGGSQTSYNVTATYSNLFAIASLPGCIVNTNGGGVPESAGSPCGDTYTQLAFHFNTVTGGPPSNRGRVLGPGQTFLFQADTDNTGGMLSPEPSSFVLLGMGAVFVYVWRRKNRLG